MAEPPTLKLSPFCRLLRAIVLTIFSSGIKDERLSAAFKISSVVCSGSWLNVKEFVALLLSFFPYVKRGRKITVVIVSGFHSIRKSAVSEVVLLRLAFWAFLKELVVEETNVSEACLLIMSASL